MPYGEVSKSTFRGNTIRVKGEEMNNKETFLEICKKSINREGIDSLLLWLDANDFFTAPASTKFHGNYEGGLCEHSLNVYNELKRLNELYKLNFSDETIAVCGLFHDICKVRFYKKSKRNVKEDGIWIEKDVWEVDDKMPFGHGEKSCILLQRFIKATFEELLAIRWHMGGFDSAAKGGDYGLSKAQDISKLVVLLHAADILASNLLEETKK